MLVAPRLLAKAPMTSNDKLQVVICADFSMYLLNPSDADTVTVKSGELFGFGPGSFEEATPGALNGFFPQLHCAKLNIDVVCTP